MDTVTLSKQNRLFWLGRYAERVYTSILYMIGQFDLLIDNKSVDYMQFCTNMGIPCPYSDEEEFIRGYTFDEAFPYSIRSSAEAMLGNGMVLRETITSPTLAYLQMARDKLVHAEKAEATALELQEVVDDIMAFRGSFDDSVLQESARNITKVGRAVERISLMLRLDWQTEKVNMELNKLLNRLYKTDLTAQPEALEIVTRAAMGGETVEPAVLLRAVEGLFSV